MRVLLFCTLTAAALVGPASAQDGLFRDVPKDHYAFDAVSSLAQKGVFTGYPDETFQGRRALTRYEVAVGLLRARSEIGRMYASGPGSIHFAGRRGPVGTAGPQGVQGRDGESGPTGPAGERPAEIDEIRRELELMRASLARVREAFGEIGREVPATRESLQETWENLERLELRFRRGQRPLPRFLRR